MAEKKQVQYGVFQRPTGSFTHGDLRFRPLTAVETPAEVVDKLDSDDVPVKFVATPEKANEEIARLRSKFNPKPNA
jgi:hypothetical protein